QVLEETRGQWDLVSLQVDVDVGRDLLCDVRDAIGASPQVLSGHHGGAAKVLDHGPDPFIIGGNDNAFHTTHGRHPIIHLLHKRLITDSSKRFSDKSARTVAGGNDDDHICTRNTRIIHGPALPEVGGV